MYDARVMKERECVWRQITCVMRQSCTAGSCLLVSEKPPMSRSHRPQAWRGEPEIPCSLGDEQDEDDSKPDPVTTSADWPRATHLMRISCLYNVASSRARPLFRRLLLLISFATFCMCVGFLPFLANRLGTIAN